MDAMAPDRYTAVWVSHSSISDFLTCPRAYYLKNIYKDPANGHKVQVIEPPLALGSAVHEVVEGLSKLPVKERFRESLIPTLERVWEKYKGQLGGFFDPDAERKYLDRGRAMIRRVQKNPGPLANLAVKINQELPYYWLSEDDNIILCGKIDWLEYLPESDSVHIIDFKTSKSEEDPNSMQLPIYHLLVHNTQNRQVAKASYWYLELADTLSERTLPDLEEAHQRVLKIAKEIKLARQLGRFKCPMGGCRACRPFEAILNGEGIKVGTNDYGTDLYVLPPKQFAGADVTVL